MLDFDLAELYDVGTKVLKQSVRRNIKRFPKDFMFELTKNEFENLRSQIVTSKKGGTRYMPMALTEHGILMLSSVLKSDRAIEMNIHIMRIFTKIKKMLLTHKELQLKMEQIERSVSSHDHQIFVLFEHLKQLLAEKKTKEALDKRKRIGFRNLPNQIFL
jgi:hypothetical protein